jgi:CspA family cold shock protein
MRFALLRRERAGILHGASRFHGSANKEPLMPTGTVKFFNDEKGFGFISRAGEDDLFVHFSNIDGTGRRSLNEGDTVEFEVGAGRKGPEAVNVKVV